MLTTLRNKSAGIVMKVILGLIVISFAVWGVEDVFRMSGSTTLATVGDTDIGVESFRERFNRALQNSAQTYGRPLSPADARAIGLDRQVLNEMMTEATLGAKARQLNLSIPDEVIADSIMTDRRFAGVNGTFDAGRFEMLLRANGLNEPMYIALQRDVLTRRQIIDGIAGGVRAPEVLTRAVHHHQSERRSASYVILPGSDGAAIAEPTEDVLRSFFEERKNTFRKPEQRSLVVVAATAESLAAKENVTDEDVRDRYEQDKDRLGKAEQRTVERITFPSLAEAQEASARIKGGATFDQIAAERAITAADLSLGTVAKSQILDQPIADAAFALAEGAVSEPVEGQFTIVILRVTGIQPGEEKTFDDVKDDLRAEIARERAQQKVHTLHDQIEDDRASGTTLKEAAQKHGLAVQTFENVDQQGRANGESAGIPGGEQTLNEAWQSDVGVENNPVQADNGYVWFDVTDVDPARDRTFEEARTEVLAVWRAEEARANLDAKAEEALKQLRDGSLTLADLATRENAQVQTAEQLDRRGGTLGQGAAAQIFSTAQGTYGSAPTGENDRVLFQVTAIETPPLDLAGEAAQQFAQRIAATIENDLAAQYLTQVQSELGTSINTQLLAATLGDEQ